MNSEETPHINKHPLIEKSVFQTLDNRNIEQIQSQGPFPCNWKNTWLGDGYYFWDTFIENAHFWGKEARASKYTNGYIICEAKCDFNTNECLDLYGDLEKLKELKELFEMYKSINRASEETTVKEFLAILKGEFPNEFLFTAIRANGVKSKKADSKFTMNLFFEKGKYSYFEFNPAVQICFFTKKSMNLRDYKIVFPTHFISK